MFIKRVCICIAFLFIVTRIFAGDIVLTNETNVQKLGGHLEILNNSNKKYNSSNVIDAKEFYTSTRKMPVFSSLDVNIWIRFSVLNQSGSIAYLNFDHPNTSVITLYKDSAGKLVKIYTGGNALMQQNKSELPNYIVNLQQGPNSDITYYGHIESSHPAVLDIYVGSYGKVVEQSNKKLNIITTYFGILLAIFFYNLFLYFVTVDRGYILYIFYIFFLGFAQFTLAGFLFKFVWLNNPWINYYAVPVSSSMAIISGVMFSMNFLRTKFYTPFIHKIFIVILVASFVSIIASFMHFNSISYFLIVFLQVVVSIVAIVAAFIIMFKGYRPATFYAVSWVLFLTGLLIFSLRNSDILPANYFTNYILYIGSAIETVLLSIALADKINVLKKEKDQSQAEALEQSRKNERLVNEQNIILEEKVSKRTAELQNANHHLNEALINLKDAQTQLVEAEKMASLGQLTAGIAHEINNPINFVKSNINPLRLDIQDLLEVLNAYGELHSLKDDTNFKSSLDKIKNLKDEIDITYVKGEIENLIAGIEEGAERTAEIVRGLRTFSRIDEASLKTVNVHDGILSTIVLLKNTIPYYIKVVKEFNAEGVIECFPGKLNQVFMNIITNAIQAIKQKAVKEDEVITIKTRDTEEGCIEISIKDSGPGMEEATKHRIFEPFFTTKDVGEGTGLGMAIVFKIIQKHFGKININSSPGNGAEFIITLPLKYKGDD